MEIFKKIDELVETAKMQSKQKKDIEAQSLVWIQKLEEVESNLKKKIMEQENELGTLEDEIEHLKEIIKSMAEVL
jgi:predicted RNase H-like nuclease (RuvC/YqgF family)